MHHGRSSNALEASNLRSPRWHLWHKFDSFATLQIPPSSHFFHDPFSHSSKLCENLETTIRSVSVSTALKQRSAVFKSALHCSAQFRSTLKERCALFNSCAFSDLLNLKSWLCVLSHRKCCLVAVHHSHPWFGVCWSFWELGLLQWNHLSHPLLEPLSCPSLSSFFLLCNFFLDVVGIFHVPRSGVACHSPASFFMPGWELVQWNRLIFVLKNDPRPSRDIRRIWVSVVFFIAWICRLTVHSAIWFFHEGNKQQKKQECIFFSPAVAFLFVRKKPRFDSFFGKFPSNGPLSKSPCHRPNTWQKNERRNRNSWSFDIAVHWSDKSSHWTMLSGRNNDSVPTVLSLGHPSRLPSQLKCTRVQRVFREKSNSIANHSTNTIPMCLLHLHSIESIHTSFQQFLVFEFHSQISYAGPRLNSKGHQVEQLTKPCYTQIRSEAPQIEAGLEPEDLVLHWTGLILASHLAWLLAFRLEPTKASIIFICIWRKREETSIGCCIIIAKTDKERTLQGVEQEKLAETMQLEIISIKFHKNCAVAILNSVKKKWKKTIIASHEPQSRVGASFWSTNNLR